MDNFLFKLQKSRMIPAAAICHNTPGRGKNQARFFYGMLPANTPSAKNLKVYYCMLLVDWVKGEVL